MGLTVLARMVGLPSPNSSRLMRAGSVPSAMQRRAGALHERVRPAEVGVAVGGVRDEATERVRAQRVVVHARLAAPAR